MANQTNNNLIVALKKQAGLGSPASGGSGYGFRLAEGSQRLALTKQIIESVEIRRDRQSTRGRHGTKSVAGAYMGELSVGSYDPFLEALLGTTWTAAAVRTYDNSAGLTSLTVDSATQITQAGTTTLLGVVAKGDLIKLANMSTAANNGIWFRVTNVTATVITLAGGATAQGADIACTLTVAKKLFSPATYVDTYWTADEYEVDTDISYLGSDIKFNRLEIVAEPDKPIMLTLGMLGLSFIEQVTGSSPVLTAPTFTTALPLVMADGTIRVNGTDYATLTGFRLAYDLGGQVPGVLASSSPDVFLGNGRLTGSVSGIRTGSTFFNLFRAETQIEFFAHMVENEADPKDFFSVYVGNAVFDGNDSQPGRDGPLVETLPLRGGKDEAGNPADATMIKFLTSAA